MQSAKTILLFLLCVVLPGACGFKGPLYLPDEEPAPIPATEQDSTPATTAVKIIDNSKIDANRMPVYG